MRNTAYNLKDVFSSMICLGGFHDAESVSPVSLTEVTLHAFVTSKQHLRGC